MADIARGRSQSQNLLVKDLVFSDSSTDRVVIDSYYSHFFSSLRNALSHESSADTDLDKDGNVQALPLKE